jgi:hypothetical protein
LPGGSDLVAVTVEGTSAREEAAGDAIDAGEEVIDVGLYFGSESLAEARMVRYVQLKHSTRRATEHWTTSGLEKTVKGFAARYAKLVGAYPPAHIASRFRFEFTSNRPIDSTLREALSDLAAGAVCRRPDLCEMLIRYTGLGEPDARRFFALFSAKGGEDSLWVQRNLLGQEITAYLPDSDYDAPVQLKELVTRKATTEFELDPSIRRHDVLRALKATEDRLQPAPRLIPDAGTAIPREQEPVILDTLVNARTPLVIHAEAGVGKSVIAARLASAMPPGSVSVLYDCFGDGLYRSTLHYRHRHQDALVQIANELAARGLCHPLIPTVHADAKMYMRAFLHRLTQAANLLRARNRGACVCVIVDAADNAEMAAKELGEYGSFVRDLIRAPHIEGVRLAFTCRTHRRHLLGAPVDTQEIHLLPFTQRESARLLRAHFPAATEAEVTEFAFLSSSNPRVQALALSRGLPLPEMLKQLGPNPTTVDRTIGDLLERAVGRLREHAGTLEASQIDRICEGLAILRPLVPISVLAVLSGTSESAVRSFALDFGRPLFVKGDSLHFLDEPAETWFRERFQPDPAHLSEFLSRLRPLASRSSYVAGALPTLLLQTGKLDELVELALSDEGLPSDSPLAKRDVELQRLKFALKASLQQKRYVAGAKLAVKAAGECAGEQRQNRLIQANTDVAALLMTPDRIEEIVSRRTFESVWMGGHHAYDAGLLSGRDELSADASSRLRMAMDWLRTWARLPQEQRNVEEVSDADRAELTLALLRLRSAAEAANFLRRWTWRPTAFEAARRVGRRLIDLGKYDELDKFAAAAGNDVWLLLGLALEARAVGHALPVGPLRRAMRLLAHRRVKLEESSAWDAKWHVLYAVGAIIEMAILALPPNFEGWADVIRRYLPKSPPQELGSRFGSDPSALIWVYALEAALRGKKLALLDVAPVDLRPQIEKAKEFTRTQEKDSFLHEVGGVLAWFVLSADVACGRVPGDVKASVQAALNEAASAEARGYGRGNRPSQTSAIQWLRILVRMGKSEGPEYTAFTSWLEGQAEGLWADTLISLTRIAARAKGFESLAMRLASSAYGELERSREDAESRADLYLKLVRAVFTVSRAEAGAYFDRAVEIASRIGDENLARWSAFLALARAASTQNASRSRTAYRLSRTAELTYEYVVRDKYFDWEGTVEAITDLSPTSVFAILSRWRDRRFGEADRLLPMAIYRLREKGHLPASAIIAFAGFEGRWRRVDDLQRALSETTERSQRVASAEVSYRYLRLMPYDDDTWRQLGELEQKYELKFQDLERLARVRHKQVAAAGGASLLESSIGSGVDWDDVFRGVDLVDPEALRLAYAAARRYEPPYEFEAFYREAFARIQVGRESELIRAIAAWPDFGIFELRYLLEALPSPIPNQIAMRTALRSAVLSVCRREPQMVRRRGWDTILPLERLDREGVVPDSDVVRAMLDGFAAQADSLDADQFFHLIDPLATCLQPDEADESLNFGLDLLEPTLRNEDGDGPWRSSLEPSGSLMAAIAGYVWAGLGSPTSAERWQWAHVVRSVMELGWSQLLEAIVDRAKLGEAGPFVDERLEFYVWHAREWFLIGLARGALENPESVVSAEPLLRLWVTEQHILIRAFAAETLRALLAAGCISASGLGDLDAVNRPSLPRENPLGWPDLQEEESKPVEPLAAEDRFHFGIDIGPYWFGPLGQAFGLPESAIERRARDVLRRRMMWKAGGWRADARHTRKVFVEGETYHSHGTLPKTDDLLAYQAYHAMMFIAADLLAQRPVLQDEGDDQDEFERWVSEHLLAREDGRWISDRRDPRLVPEAPPPEGYSDKAWRWSVTRTYLDQQLTTDDGMIVIWGDWAGGHDDLRETVSIRCALVTRQTGASLVAALQLSPALATLNLPSVGDEERLGAGDFIAEGFVYDERSHSRLETADPWAKALAFPGPVPSGMITSALSLVSSAGGRLWTSERGGRLRTETWTHEQGYGREADTTAGTRMSCDRQFVAAMLEAHPDKVLAISVHVKRRGPRGAATENEVARADYAPYARYYLMEADGVAQSL